MRGPPWVPSVTSLEAFAGGEPGGDAAGAVAGELGFGAVGVEEAEEEVAVGAAVEELDAVGADAGVAAAELAGEGGVAVEGEGLFDDEEVVAAGVGFDEGYAAHSSSVSLKTTTLSVASLASSSWWMRAWMLWVAVTMKETRSMPAMLSRSRTARRWPTESRTLRMASCMR